MRLLPALMRLTSLTLRRLFAMHILSNKSNASPLLLFLFLYLPIFSVQNHSPGSAVVHYTPSDKKSRTVALCLAMFTGLWNDTRARSSHSRAPIPG